jgi:hypothetical protein
VEAARVARSIVSNQSADRFKQQQLDMQKLGAKIDKFEKDSRKSMKKDKRKAKSK